MGNEVAVRDSDFRMCLTCRIGHMDERQSAPFSHIAIQDYSACLEFMQLQADKRCNFLEKRNEMDR